MNRLDLFHFATIRLSELVCPLLASGSPLAGRLAFAAVFAALILWLLWIPAEKLRDPSQPFSDYPTVRAPSETRIRVAAIAIAAIQLALYLFWQ